MKQKRVVLTTFAFACFFAMAGGLVGVTDAHAAGTGYMSFSSYSGIPGSTVNASGSAFQAGETVNILRGSISGPVVASTTVAGDTTFGPLQITIPADATQGDLSFVAIGASSSISASNVYYVDPLFPAISATSTVDTPEGTVMVSGTGFAADESVLISLAGATTTATSDATGAFPPATITIPFSASGSETITAQGLSSGASATTYFYVGGFYPSVVASSYYAYPGDTITFTGNGFAPDETVNIFEDGATTTLASVPADASGTFTDAGAVTIPVGTTATSTTFSLVGASSSASTSATIALGSRSVSVTPSGYYFLPGQTISFSGSGFLGNETVNVTESGATTTLASFPADASGTFTDAGAFVIPSSLANSTSSFTVSGASSGASAQVEISVGGYFPYLSLSQAYLQRGNSFTVTGYNFAPDENVMFSTYGNATDSATADASGTVSGGPFQVPLSAPSSIVVMATGGTSGATASATLTIGDTVARQLSSSTLSISLAVDNTAGGSESPSDFTVSVTGASPTPASFTATTTPTVVTVEGDTDFSVSATSSDPNYVISSSGTCDGQIVSTESGSCALTATYVLPIAIQPSGLSDATMNSAYSASLGASTTAPGPFTWSVASGTLPAGITLDTSSTASTTSLSGVPTETGTFTFTIAAASGSSTAEQAYTLNVDAAPSAPSNGGGGVTVVTSGGGGGGSYYYPPTTSTVTATSTASSSGGQVLGASAVNVSALRAQLLELEQHLLALQFASAMPGTVFTENLREGMSGSAVMELQKILNSSPLTQVAASGPGSPGNETGYFGPATAKAVIALQNIFVDSILAPEGLSSGTGYVGPATRAELDALCAGGSASSSVAMQ